jgi:hypothetical protein
LLTTSGEPSSVNKALIDKHWKKAMDLEYDALVKNKTWHIVPPMKGRTIVGCKWVYTIKGSKMVAWIDTKRDWLQKGLNKDME